MVSGGIRSDAGEQGLPCEGMCWQGKPCTPGVISNAIQFVRVTFNSTRVEVIFLGLISATKTIAYRCPKGEVQSMLRHIAIAL